MGGLKISQDQLEELAKLIGKKKLQNIIPHYKPIFNENKIYAYRGYKLHRVSENSFAWVDMTSSTCYANGTGTAEDLITRAGAELKIFDRLSDYAIWLNTIGL